MANRWIRIEDNFVGVAYVCENCGRKEYLWRRICPGCGVDTRYELIHEHLLESEVQDADSD